jgi:proline iminopeptidase
MKNFFLSGFFCVMSFICAAQNIYVKTFGDVQHPAFLFLHGGPGFNCVNFEVTTAEDLSKQGFFVMVYDRRGEGRSEDPNAKFTFDEASADVLSILDKYGVKKVNLIAHSFGGIVSTEFCKRHPERVQSLIMVGAPISLQESFSTILSSCKSIYSARKDSVSLGYIDMLEKMDRSSLEFSSYCFVHAKQNGFYQTKNQTDEAKEVRNKAKSDSLFIKYGSKNTNTATLGYWKNEHYTTLDLTSDLAAIKSKSIPVFGLYGQEDGLYSAAQIEALQQLIGKENLVYFDRCSHNVFVDQHAEFIKQLTLWVKR